MAQLDKKILKHLEELARLEAGETAEGKLLKDLEKILGYFEELKKVDTTNVEPMAGGTELINEFREDKESPKSKIQSSGLIEAFPEEKDGYLKIPPVFE